MRLTALLLPTYTQMLRMLAAALDKAAAQLPAEDASALPGASLAPDMFPRSTQIRFACVQAWEGVHRLRGEPLPAALEDLLDEGRSGRERPGALAEAKARIDEVLALLAGVDDAALDARAEEPLELALPMGLTFDMTGEQYVRDWALPQFYFHVMAAYAILRSHGVALGKADYVAHAFPYLRQPPA